MCVCVCVCVRVQLLCCGKFLSGLNQGKKIQSDQVFTHSWVEGNDKSMPSPRELTRCEMVKALSNNKNRFRWLSLVLWHINHCRLFNAKSIFIHIHSSISDNSFRIGTVFV